MLIMDVPDAPSQQAPIIVLSQASQRSGQSTEELYGTVGVCYLSPKTEQIDPEKDKEGYYSISPRAYADNIFSLNPTPARVFGYETAEVSVLQPPQHGTLSKDFSPYKNLSYYPEAGYVGNDKVIFLVNIEGYKIKVVYFIKVLDSAGDTKTLQRDYDRHCPHPNWWKVSQSPDASGSLISASDQLSSWLSLAQSDGKLADLSGVTVTFGLLANGAVGQTTITLDTNAAGYNWSIAALANDVDANQPGFVPVIVQDPAHGQATVNADGGKCQG